MIKGIIASLLIGIVVGLGGTGLENSFSQIADIALVVLMFSVGISVGMNKQVFDKLKTYHFKILIIPTGVIIGSTVGGVLCAMLLGMPLNESLAITSGLGWYSLSGVLVTDLAGAEVGSIAFLANLFREIISFMIIPVVAKYCNDYTVIAPAAATSEDTTLPLIMKYTSEEVVMMAVINGVVCSAMVPILIQTFYQAL